MLPLTAGSKRPTLNAERPTPKLQSDFEIERSMLGVRRFLYILLWASAKDPASSISKKL
jgi:hypothetical protein